MLVFCKLQIFNFSNEFYMKWLLNENLWWFNIGNNLLIFNIHVFISTYSSDQKDKVLDYYFFAGLVFQKMAPQVASMLLRLSNNDKMYICWFHRRIVVFYASKFVHEVISVENINLYHTYSCRVGFLHYFWPFRLLGKKHRSQVGSHVGMSLHLLFVYKYLLSIFF